MIAKWQKNTVILLVGTFFILSFTAEFAHRHTYSQTSTLIVDDCKSEIHADEKNSAQKIFKICFSCVYSQTPVVLSISFQLSEGLASCQVLKSTIDQPQISFFGSLFDSRAPPQNLS